MCAFPVMCHFVKKVSFTSYSDLQQSVIILFINPSLSDIFIFLLSVREDDFYFFFIPALKFLLT